MSKKTTNAAAAINAAAAKTTTKKTAEKVAKETTTNAAPVFADFTPVQVLETAAAWIKKYGTISNIRADFAALVSIMGKKNFSAVLKQCQTTRAAEIAAVSDSLNNAVFTGTGILSAVMHAVNKERAYSALCGYAKREYKGTDAETAAAVIRDYYTAVDNNGAPLTRVSYINAAAVEIYAVYDLKPVSHTNAVSILKTALDNMGKSAKNAATRSNGNDNAAAVRDNVKKTGAIVAVYAAALDETDHATIGTRRDNAKDEKTRAAAAALIGKSLPVGCIPVPVYNAAMNGNENALDALETARAAAKDAAARKVAQKGE